jgi:hypothetical protein
MLFSVIELQILDSVGTSPTPGEFATPEAIKAFGCKVYNAGMEDVYLVFGLAKDVEATGEKDSIGKPVHYVPAGETVLLDKGPTKFFSAMTDSGSTKIYLHAGKGS